MRTAQDVIDQTQDKGTANLSSIVENVQQTIVIDRPLTVRGGAFRPNKNFEGPVISIKAPYVRLVGQLILAEDSPATGIISEGDYGEITGCLIRGTYAGIVCVSTAAHVLVNNNRITKTNDNCIYMSSARNCVVTGNVLWEFAGHSGIKCRGWSNIISNNAVSNGVIGITVTGINGSSFPEFNWRVDSGSPAINGHSNIVTGNTIENMTKFGIFMDSKGGLLWGTRITNNTIVRPSLDPQKKHSGIRIHGPMTLCSGNLVTNTTDRAVAAIDAYEADDSLIANNHISGTAKAFSIPEDRSFRVREEGNVVATN